MTSIEALLLLLVSLIQCSSTQTLHDLLRVRNVGHPDSALYSVAHDLLTSDHIDEIVGVIKNFKSNTTDESDQCAHKIAHIFESLETTNRMEGVKCKIYT